MTDARLLVLERGCEDEGNIASFDSKTSRPFNFWFITTNGWNFFALTTCYSNQFWTSSCWTAGNS